MPATSMIHVRMDENIKTAATVALSAMGLTVSDAVRVFMTRVASEKQLPFSLRVPNEETRLAMEEAEEMLRARSPRFQNAEEMFSELEKPAKNRRK